jgi:hypothetical protein
MEDKKFKLHIFGMGIERNENFQHEFLCYLLVTLGAGELAGVETLGVVESESAKYEFVSPASR